MTKRKSMKRKGKKHSHDEWNALTAWLRNHKDDIYITAQVDHRDGRPSTTSTFAADNFDHFWLWWALMAAKVANGAVVGMVIRKWDRERSVQGRTRTTIYGCALTSQGVTPMDPGQLLEAYEGAEPKPWEQYGDFATEFAA
jgi:hypothetical protein